MNDKKLLVIDCAALGWDQARTLTPGGLSFRKMEPAFPAVTCTAQATFRTARLPSEHGMVGNGLFFRDLKKPMFWEQASSLVAGPRTWDGFRARGKKVGIMFWQQSLGESADLILSPKPIHKHGGGMVQDCYSRPHDLYRELCDALGRRFNLMHYWGPLASHRSSQWIVDATMAVMGKGRSAPDLLLTYLPHLDYDLQRHGPASRQAAKALTVLGGYLEQLHDAARQHGYEVLIFGDYAIKPVTSDPVFPNRALREAGLFNTRTVEGRTYPDFFSSPAAAIADHEVAHVVTAGPEATGRAREVLATLPGVAECLDRAARAQRGVDHVNSGELLLVAEEGSWFAYPWWTGRREAPDYATHVDIHNKPGYDPCELFFGWPPGSVSRDTGRIRGSHGRAGPGREAAWASTCTWDSDPASLPELAGAVKTWLDTPS
jgi:predicted AlkP superfamily pyrophosphatase or phosphodiesterase